jgi:DUF4097 and DUF4098 domain-containing protein YvlB
MLRRTVLTSLWILVLGATLAAGADLPYEEIVDQTFSVSVAARVSLENVNGDASIETWDRDEVWVQAVKRASSPDLLAALRIDIDASSNSVDIDTHYPTTHGSGQGISVEYTLTVPRHANVDSIELVNGNLRILDVEGGVAAACVNGTIRASNLAGRIELESVNGAVELEVGRLDPAGEISVESVNGGLEIFVPAAAGVAVHAETVNGSISNDLGLEVRKGQYVGSSMHGVVGSGGTELSLETVNGPISVRAR